MSKGFTHMLTVAVLLGLAWGIVDLAGTPAVAQDKKEKKQKDPREGKKGTVIGVLAAKTTNSIELKADGEEKARKYVPQWRGGAPAQGGGPDKAILKTISELTIGSRLEVEWVFQERLRCLKIKVLKAAKK